MCFRDIILQSTVWKKYTTRIGVAFDNANNFKNRAMYIYGISHLDRIKILICFFYKTYRTAVFKFFISEIPAFKYVEKIEV